MTNSITIEFASVEQSGRVVISEAENLNLVAERLVRARNTLFSSGLHGSFTDLFDERVTELFNRFRMLNAECDETGHDLLTVVRRARELDIECARLFSESNPARATTHPALSGRTASGAQGYERWTTPPDPYTTRYGLGNAAWHLANLVSQFGLGKGAGDVAAAALLANMGLSGMRRFIPVAGGVIDGLMDYQLEYGDGPFNGRAFATEISSGLLQAGVSLTGAGMLVMAGNAVVQVAGHGGTYVLYHSAESLAGDDPALANVYRRQANDLNRALEAGDLDSAFDAIAENIIDIFTGDGSVQQNLGEMAEGVGATASGVGQIAFEYTSTRTVLGIGVTKRNANILMDVLQVDKTSQQNVNRQFDMVLQDTQDLDLGDLSSFQRVAQRRIDYYRNAFGI